MSTVSRSDELIAQLYEIDGKAEIVGGEIVLMSPTGRRPTRAAVNICRSLETVEKRLEGWAYGDNLGYLVDLPNRKSLSPDASFDVRQKPAEDDLSFAEGSPIFAAEVRSENDYGPAAEKAMAEKRADYFAAGTKVVWDVDLLSDDIVRVYRADKPTEPAIYRRGEQAEAEPAVPGWKMPVDELFE